MRLRHFDHSGRFGSSLSAVGAASKGPETCPGAPHVCCIQLHTDGVLQVLQHHGLAGIAAMPIRRLSVVELYVRTVPARTSSGVFCNVRLHTQVTIYDSQAVA